MSSPILVAVGICLDDQHRTLVLQRPAGTHLGGSWEWPGGKVRAGEAPAEALRREWMEEVGVRPDTLAPLRFVWHRYPERELLLLFYRVCASDPGPTSADGRPVRWVSPRELKSMPFPEANREILDWLDRALQTSSAGHL